MSARTSVKIDLSGSDAVRAVREGFSSLEKSERSRVLRAFRRARSRVLTLYGAEAAAKLAEDFRLKKSFVRGLRLFRSTAKGRVWVGGNQMNLTRYEHVEKTPGGVSVPRFGVIPGAFILRVRGGEGGPVFAPEGTALPGWATFSGGVWRPRGSRRGLRKVAVRGPENFAARYAPNEAAVRALFEAEFLKNLDAEK